MMKTDVDIGTLGNSTFVVVEFPEEVTEDETIPMEIVSSTWLGMENNNIYCYWPKGKSSDSVRRKMVVEHCPVTAENGEKCPINIKYYCKSFEKALSKLKYLEVHSSVSQSEDNEIQPKKRTSFNNKNTNDYWYSQNYNVSSSSDEEIDVPQAPKVTKTPNIATPNTSRKKHPPKNIHSLTWSPSTTSLISNQQSIHHPQNVCSSTGMPRCNPNTSPLLSNQRQPIPSCSNGACATQEALLRSVLTRLGSLEDNVKYLMKLVQGSQKVNILEENDYCKTLPAVSSEHLEEFNRELNNEGTLQSVCATFAVVGGKDGTDTTRRVMSKVLTNQLCLQYNWSGRNGKKSFSELKNVIKLIVGVVRQNPLCRSATITEVESVIKVWLRNALDRDGGRSNRRNKKHNNGKED